MTTLDFNNCLRENPFAYGNVYSYGTVAGTGIFHSNSDEELPYILRADYNGITCHRNYEIYYSTYSEQLYGRVLATSRIKEVLDTAHWPLIIGFPEGSMYLMGKGFLAECAYNTKGTLEINPLFVAYFRKNQKLEIKNIKFYISREVFLLEKHKRVQPAIKDLMLTHEGDVVTTNNISQYVGHKFKFPEFKTVAEKNEFDKRLKLSLVERMKYCKLPVEDLIGERDIL